MPNKKPPRRSNALKLHVQEMSLTPVHRYVAVQREREKILSIGKVDVDIEQIIGRSFLCDRHRCIQWTPHERKADARPLIDNSCCARYTVPVTDLDRRKLAEILPLVRERLPADHPLNEDPDEPPYEAQEDYSFAMREREGGVCQFVIYDEGRTACSIHKTCLEEGLDVWAYKPIGCSLWPLALVDYETDGEERYLLTIYARATAGLFEGEDEDEDESFACLVDQDPAYEPLYRSMSGVISHILGEDFYRQLDRRAQRYLAKQGE